MLALSPFQCLPLHIAEAIGRYFTGLQRHHRNSLYQHSRRAKKAWTVLHDVSYSWSVLALENLYESVSLELGNDYGQRAFSSTLMLTEDDPGGCANMCTCTKTVNITISDTEARPTGNQLCVLDRVWPNDLVLPKAHTLIVDVSDEANIEPTINADDDAFFDWLAQRIRSSLPNLHRAEFRFGFGTRYSINPDMIYSKERDAGSLLAALFRTVRWDANAVSDSLVLANTNLIKHCAPELTRFVWVQGLEYKFAVWIARHSAASLELVEFRCFEDKVLTDLLFGEDGQSIVYPRLQQLNIHDNRAGDVVALTADKSIVPFPILRRLTLNTDCVFKDDTIFRGNNSTLVELNVTLRGSIGLFREHAVFTKDTHPKLHHLTVIHDHWSSFKMPVGDFTKVAFRLVLPATRTFSLDACISYQLLIDSIPTCAYVENIQILNLLNVELTFLEVLNVIKLFPNVSDFTCCFSGIELHLDTNTGESIADRLDPQYHVVSRRLKRWNMNPIPFVPIESLITSALTLSDLCPTFTFVEVVPIGILSNTVFLSNLAADKGDAHANRVQRLFCYE